MRNIRKSDSRASFSVSVPVQDMCYIQDTIFTILSCPCVYIHMYNLMSVCVCVCVCVCVYIKRSQICLCTINRTCNESGTF